MEVEILVHLLLTLKAYVKGVASGLVYHTGASIPRLWDRGDVLPIFMKGDVHGNSPLPIFWK